MFIVAMDKIPYHESNVCAGEKDISGEASVVLGSLKDAATGRDGKA
jgi:hypothetical protein